MPPPPNGLLLALAPLLLRAPGGLGLAPPQNVTLLSRNFSIFLVWAPAPGYPLDTSYVVNYQSFENQKRWRKVPPCHLRAQQTCDLTCLVKNQHIKFKGRVRAVTPGARSPWAESQYLDYIFDVELAPPVLEVRRLEAALIINATVLLPVCESLEPLKYDVDFWEAGRPRKMQYPGNPMGQVVEISTPPAISGNYCLSARTTYTIFTPKHSLFSPPQCLQLGSREEKGTLLLRTGLPLLVLLLLLCAPVSCLLLRAAWAKQAKMPPALDFSGSRLPIRPLEARTLEVLSILTVCSRKGPAAPRKPEPPARDPPGSEEEEEEEDEDDRDVFWPYLKPPPFPEGTPSASAPSLGEMESEGDDVEGGGSPALHPDSEGGAGGISGSSASSSSSSWEMPFTNGYVTGNGQRKRQELSRNADVPLMPEVSEWAPLTAGELGGCPSASIWDAPRMRDLKKGAAQAPFDPEEPFICLQTLVFATARGPHSLSGDEETSLGSEEEEEAAFLDPPGLGNVAPGSPEVQSCSRVRPSGYEPGHYMVRSQELCSGC
ncbi:interferon lambda receptor 1 [Tachyglossus aculeatus]|uniref:interferon lambda receptor 1 n=1 Tax=Tachyglossus aculeatus TaxID=9261 RepID=UPI0018F6C87F|nr:interferon lambda receptor 1 [Tachyglossus aculeatus]